MENYCQNGGRGKGLIESRNNEINASFIFCPF
jgi:hypothetical protein